MTNINNNNEIVSLEKEIDSIDDILDWSSKIKKIKELKEHITTYRNKLNSFIDIINSGYIKKKKKNVSLDDLLKQFQETEDIEEKVKLFNQIQFIIKENELDLFED